MAIKDAEEKAALYVDTSDQEHERDTVEKSDDEATLEQDNVQDDAEIPKANQEVVDYKEEGEKEEDIEQISKEMVEGDKELTDNEDEEKPEEVEEEVEVSKKGKEPVTSIDRPIRERRRTDFYKDPSYGKAAPPKLSVEKGSGTKLKDIPNVAFKLSKRKPDDTLHLLHLLLFGKKGKNQTLKKNIGQFSGYVWAEDEEKLRAKLREKFDKCIKEKLHDFCDVLNVSINKSNTRKADVIDKLLEFLESPRVTTETLLADKVQKAKVTPSKPSPGEASTKKSKRTTEVSEKQMGEEETEDKSVFSDVKDDSDKDNGEVEKESEPAQTEDDEPPKQRKEAKKIISKANIKGGSRCKSKSTPVKKDSASKSVQAASTPTSRKRARGADTTSGSSSKAKGPVSKKHKIEKGANEGSSKGLSSKAKASVSKKQNIKKEAKGGSSKGKEKATVKKEPTKAPAKQKASAKDKGKGKSTQKPKAKPSREEIHAIVADMLKEVDFNTVTLSDVIRQLGTHFGIDLMHRKVEVKDIIADIINNMTDDEDEEGEELGKKGESGDEEEGDAEDKGESGDDEEK